MSMPCDVVILPSYDLTAKAVNASAKLAQLGSLFTLEDGKQFPHASLYMFQLNEDNLSAVKDALARVADSTQALHLMPNGYVQKLGFIDVGYKVSPELNSLQEQVLEAVQPLADGMREKDKARMLEASGLALQNFQKYGYKYVGELFRPHMTFTRFPAEEDKPEAEELLPDVMTFAGDFTKLGLYEMGENGTCIREVASWKLQ